MLIELRIGQLAIVDELALPFGPGLTVLTGETGAGKSVIAGALGLLCGGHVPKELVRQGEECGWVEGVFDLADAPARRDELTRLGVRLGADQVLVLRRELRLQGRNRVLINGLVSSLALLEQIGPRLLAIQSQDQQRELADPAYARDLLDELAGAEPARRRAREAWTAHRDAAAELAARRREEAAATEQLDIWRYQAQELAQARLREEEPAELAERLGVLRHAGALQAGAAAALARLDGADGAAREQLAGAAGALRAVGGKSQRLAEVQSLLETAEAGVADAVQALRRFLDALDLEPQDLDALEERAALYADLQRKYRLDVPGLLQLLGDLQRRLERQDAAGAELARLAAAAAAARHRLQEAVLALHAARIAAAPGVGRAAAAKIRPLALPALEVEFRVGWRHDPAGTVEIDGRPVQATADGADRVELRVRTNPGERMGPVGDIASGGERSRIHLGLTALRRAAESPPLLLCDEIDAGLGMDAAQPVGRLLRELAAAGQVVCISHLPTMAVFGDSHWRVEKAARGGRTILTVHPLGGEARIGEIARLLGGEAGTGDTAPARLSYAAALLQEAARGGA